LRLRSTTDLLRTSPQRSLRKWAVPRARRSTKGVRPRPGTPVVFVGSKPGSRISGAAFRCASRCPRPGHLLPSRVLAAGAKEDVRAEIGYCSSLDKNPRMIYLSSRPIRRGASPETSRRRDGMRRLPLRLVTAAPGGSGTRPGGTTTAPQGACWTGTGGGERPPAGSQEARTRGRKSPQRCAERRSAVRQKALTPRPPKPAQGGADEWRDGPGASRRPAPLAP
jgi:hypothetical protein